MPPPASTDPLSRILDFITANPQIAGTYGTLTSAAVALAAAFLALRQSSTARRALEVTRESLEEAQTQGRLARASLAQSEARNRRDRFNVYAPVVSPILYPELDYLLTDHEPKSSQGVYEQFHEIKRSFDKTREVELDLNGFNFDEPDTVWLSGRLLLRNEGPTSALVSPSAWHYEAIEGDPIVRLGDSTFLLEPGSRTLIFWVETYSVSGWLDDTLDALHKRATPSEGKSRRDSHYAFKHLGERADKHFLMISSPAVPELIDYYDAKYEFLVLSDLSYSDRVKKGYYKFGRNGISVTLGSRLRTYPDEDKDRER